MTEEPEAAVDPDLGHLGASLRSAWHADYEETADAARMQWEHGRTFIDRIHDAMARGDRVQCRLPHAHFTGLITNLGTDWCTIETPAGPIDVHLATNGHTVATPVMLRTVARGRTGGIRSTQPPMGFRARCYELEMARGPVQVGALACNDILDGTLVVGADHLVVSGPDNETVLPLDSVGWIASDCNLDVDR